MAAGGRKARRSTSPISNDGYVRKLKGTIDSGKVELVIARDESDTGQTALRAAAATWNAHNFKVELNDAPVGGTPTTFYFRGPVLSAKLSLGTADDVVKQTFTVAVSGQVFEVWQPRTRNLQSIASKAMKLSDGINRD